MKDINIRKKLVSLAVASVFSGGAMLAAAPAHALNVSQDNVGQVLLFPYYTVKNGLDTLHYVVNTSPNTVVFKVRYREALNSREVRDFNVVLSPNDVWTAVVTKDALGNGAVLRTFDNTCTSPILPASGTMSGAREINFTNALFSGNFKDGGSEDMSRVQEGYFEIISMGMSTRSTDTSTNTLEYNAKHVNGVPRSCTKVDELFLDTATNLSYLATPENVLKGHSTLIDVATGKAIDASPTTLENWITTGNAIAAPGDLTPSLADGDAVGNAYRLVDGALQTISYTAAEDGVSDLLRNGSVINQYATGTNAATSWVVTFPTKHHYTDAYTADVGPTVEDGTATGGFSEWFYNGTGDGRSCDNVSIVLYNREEGSVTPGGTSFSPRPVSSSVELCYEVNVINFNNSNVFGSGVNRLGVDTSGVGQAGWAELKFTEASATTLGAEASATTLGGLPVIGFAATMRDSGNATVNYGSSEPHAYVTRTLP